MKLSQSKKNQRNSATLRGSFAALALLSTGSLGAWLAVSIVTSAPASRNPASVEHRQFHPCQEIAKACVEAGFKRGGAKNGTGLGKNCMYPLMQGKNAEDGHGKPLPLVAPELITQCKDHRTKKAQKI